MKTVIMAVLVAFSFSAFAVETDLRSKASNSISAIRAANLSLDGLEEVNGNQVYRQEFFAAIAGNSEAALRVSKMYSAGSNSLPVTQRRAEQWLRVAAELGNATAMWQLAEIANNNGQVGMAARYETMASAAGFQAPARLPSKSLNF